MLDMVRIFSFFCLVLIQRSFSQCPAKIETEDPEIWELHIDIENAFKEELAGDDAKELGKFDRAQYLRGQVMSMVYGLDDGYDLIGRYFMLCGEPKIWHFGAINFGKYIRPQKLLEHCKMETIRDCITAVLFITASSLRELEDGSHFLKSLLLTEEDLSQYIQLINDSTLSDDKWAILATIYLSIAGMHPEEITAVLRKRLPMLYSRLPRKHAAFIFGHIISYNPLLCGILYPKANPEYLPFCKPMFRSIERDLEEYQVNWPRLESQGLIDEDLTIKLKASPEDSPSWYGSIVKNLIKAWKSYEKK